MSKDDMWPERKLPPANETRRIYTNVDYSFHTKFVEIILWVLLGVAIGLAVSYYFMPRNPDLNRDGKVDLLDFSIFSSKYKQD